MTPKFYPYLVTYPLSLAVSLGVLFGILSNWKIILLYLNGSDGIVSNVFARAGSDCAGGDDNAGAP